MIGVTSTSVSKNKTKKKKKKSKNKNKTKQEKEKVFYVCTCVQHLCTHYTIWFLKWQSPESGFDYFTPVLFDLHWLPVIHRINFKVLLLTYKTLCGMAPAYMSDIIHPYVPARTLRSSSSNLLQMPSARTITYRERSLLNQGSKTVEFSAAKHQAGWIGWSLQGTLKTISVQTGIWLVTHSFNVFCSSSLFPLCICFVVTYAILLHCMSFALCALRCL